MGEPSKENGNSKRKAKHRAAYANASCIGLGLFLSVGRGVVRTNTKYVERCNRRLYCVIFFSIGLLDRLLDHVRLYNLELNQAGPGN